ncbi:MAG TPA: amidohydrolase family protein [Dehalococcoidales bacterium]|nr:amidohydrolase family protein [Dehalococcoidales bacterium]
MKFDVFPHILTRRYYEELHKEKGLGHFEHLHKVIPTLYDLDHRFRIMDQFEGLMQILNIAAPPLENIGNPGRAAELARLANDEMAELVVKYRDRFAAAVACISMDDMDAALVELDRAINDLNFKGVQIYTPVLDKPLDSPEFFPLYEKMCQYNLPIILHPQREGDYPDYRTEKASKYTLSSSLGWPHETTVAMVRLVLSGVMEKFPDLKIVTHHCGGMVPFMVNRIAGFTQAGEIFGSRRGPMTLRYPVADYLHRFYADTAIYGYTPGLMCGYAFFGAGHLLFGTDMPFDSQYGLRWTRETIASIERMDIPDAERKMIFEDNARRLFRLSV